MSDIKNFACDCEAIHEDTINRVRELTPDSNEFARLAELYKLFGDKTRLRIMWALSCEEMCVCDLAVLLDMTKSAVSHQLKALRIANLVKYDKQGKEVYYSLADDHVRTIFREGFEHLHE